MHFEGKIRKFDDKRTVFHYVTLVKKFENGQLGWLS